MITNLNQLMTTRELIWAWTGRTVRGRYQQSILGWLWAIVQPAATAVIFTIVFTRFIPVDTGDVPYIIYSYSAMVPWTLFSTSLNDMASSIVGNMSLIKKIYFPREAIPIAAMAARLMDFGIAGVLLFVLMLIYEMPLYLSSLLFLPVILCVQLALIMGLGLATAALNIFYRDVQPLLRLLVQIWMYASPIIYTVSDVPENLQPYYRLNPMVGILEGYRAVLLRGEFPGVELIPSAVIAALVFAGGYWAFKRVEYQFADVV